MFKKLQEKLLDEFVAWKLLRLIFGYRQQPPYQLSDQAVPSGLMSGNRREFFQPAPQPIEFRYEDAHDCNDDLPIVKRTFRFPSPVESLFPENQNAVCTEWTDSRTSNRVLVGMDGIVQFRDAWFEKMATILVPEGWTVIMLDAPYNHRRVPDGYRPGQLITLGNLSHQLNVSRQTILDLWTLILSLQSQGKQVGLAGVSFGGWATTTVSQIVDDLLFLHAVTPVLEMAWVLREGGAIVRAVSRGLGDELPSWDEIERITRPISPYHFVPSMDPKTVFFHAALYDQFLPTERIRAYSRKIGANLIEYKLGHISATCRLRMAESIAKSILDHTPSK